MPGKAVTSAWIPGLVTGAVSAAAWAAMAFIIGTASPWEVMLVWTNLRPEPRWLRIAWNLSVLAWPTLGGMLYGAVRRRSS